MAVNLIILLAITSAYSTNESFEDYQPNFNVTLNGAFDRAPTAWNVTNDSEDEEAISRGKSSDGSLGLAFWEAWEAHNSSYLESHTFAPSLSSKAMAVTQATDLDITTVSSAGYEHEMTSPTTVPAVVTSYSHEDQVNKPIADIWPVKLAAEVPGDLIIGGLMMVHEREDTITCGPIMPQGGIQAVETMLYTLDTVNKGLKHFRIGVHILDDCDKDTYGLEMAVDFIKGKLIMNKWLHVRDNFTRSQKKPKSGDSAKPGRKYIFSQQLSFLIHSHTPASSESSLETTEATDVQQSQISDYTEGESVPTSQEKRRKITNSRLELIEESLLNFLNTPTENRQERSRETTGTQSFKDSLVPIVERFTEDDQLHFRCEVMNLITTIRTKEKERSYQFAFNQLHPQAFPEQWNTQRHSYPFITRDPRLPASITSFPQATHSPQTAPVQLQPPYHEVAGRGSVYTYSRNVHATHNDVDSDSLITSPKGSEKAQPSKNKNGDVAHSVGTSAETQRSCFTYDSPLSSNSDEESLHLL